MRVERIGVVAIDHTRAMVLTAFGRPRAVDLQASQVQYYKCSTSSASNKCAAWNNKRATYEAAYKT